ncbi:MAG: Phospho-N-acetylmuramoyl-pentapeptide-transferase, partial [Cyanobacteriota bacterium erpe_2018_sw_39hr_WHONDRS-SW48-000098_B_bin.30]|nr:Phospho-N-acetylmuramoyl-pentapeptide-transferase [Cyanobacteriota bacterium erpe_2018_sw_39hr_WHONDRS-SW48-000098_B_bin.30]
WQVVAAFWAVQFVLCVAVLAAFESFRSGLPCGLFH